MNFKSYNKTTIFLLPFVNFPTSYLLGLENCYIKNAEAQTRTEKNELYIGLYDTFLSSMDVYNITKLEGFVDFTRYNNYLLFKFRIDSFYNDFIDLFIKGRYTEVSLFDKTTILKYWLQSNYDIVNVRKNYKLYKIFFPEESDYKALQNRVNDFNEFSEITDSLNLIDETFFISNIINIKY
jgi:hypothetical protein